MTKYIDPTDDYIMQLSKLQLIEDELKKIQSYKPSIFDELHTGNTEKILEEVRSIKMDIKKHIQEIEDVKGLMKKHYDKQLAQIREIYEQQLQSQRQIIYGYKSQITSLQVEKQQHKTSTLLSDSLRNSLAISMTRSLTAVKDSPEKTLNSISKKKEETIEDLKQQLAIKDALIKQQENKLNASQAKDKFIDSMNDSYQREMYYKRKCEKMSETLAEQKDLYNQKQQEYMNIIIQMEQKIMSCEQRLSEEQKIQQITKINEKQQEIITKQQQELIKQNSIIQSLREQVSKFSDIQKSYKDMKQQTNSDDEQNNDIFKLFFQIQTLKQVIDDQESLIIKKNQQNRELNQQIFELKAQLLNIQQTQQ